LAKKNNINIQFELLIKKKKMIWHKNLKLIKKEEQIIKLSQQKRD